jgi:hypothetical protein
MKNRLQHLKQFIHQNREMLRLAFVYIVSSVTVVTVVLLLTLFVLGYRLNLNDGTIEQYALLQIDSDPSGASVTIDGVELSARTPTKASINSGQREVTLSKDGYHDWSKDSILKPGMVTWYNYALLIPEVLRVESVVSLPPFVTTLSSDSGRRILALDSELAASFTLVNLSSESATIKRLALPTGVSSPVVDGSVSKYELVDWNDSERYATVLHQVAGRYEWILLDTQDETLSKNISKMFDVTIDQLEFVGNGGNSFYSLSSGTIRKLDIQAGTISRPVVERVVDFSLSSRGVVSYRSIGADSLQSVGIFRESDNIPIEILSSPNAEIGLRIGATRYFNQDYLVYSQDRNVKILIGGYPNAANKLTTSMKIVDQFELDSIIDSIGFSQLGQYVMIKHGDTLSSYDLEYGNLAHIDVSEISEPLWLNDNYLYAYDDNELVIFEFDGMNKHRLGATTPGQAVTITDNSKYIYKFNASVLERIALTN